MAKLVHIYLTLSMKSLEIRVPGCAINLPSIFLETRTEEPIVYTCLATRHYCVFNLLGHSNLMTCLTSSRGRK